MCGRFTQKTPAPALIEHFQLPQLAEAQLPLFQPRYNIAPTQDIAAIRIDPESGERAVAAFRWGLVPFWAKDPSIGNRMINARSETAAEKPSFRAAIKRRRCLIIADGFYEWQKQASGKQPYYIRRPDAAPFAFAGLWESWRPKEEQQGPTMESCTILTTAANNMMAPLHERMPVIVLPSDYDTWLDPQLQSADDIRHLLVASPDDLLVADPVSTHVNKPTHDDPQCITLL